MMKRGSKLLKNKERMEDSNENNDVVAHSPFLLSIFNFFLRILMSILKFLTVYVYRPIPLSSKDSYVDESHPPPTAVDPPVDQLVSFFGFMG